ncbi:hypothetical protein ACFYRD_38100 [Streptomyces hirsutus]|uniref:hypothetical protein n=1 Tax=Streptomyces hirsutus TaxID=35620 RepID=UPI0036A89E4E
MDAADPVAPGRRWAETPGRVVRALGQRPLSDATVRRIVERAEDNAFYAEELLAATDSPAGGMPSRLSGDDAGARRWAEAATELVGPARASAAHGEDGTPQGPEGQAWLARAEAEWTRAVSGPDVAAWAKAVAGFPPARRAGAPVRRAVSPSPLPLSPPFPILPTLPTATPNNRLDLISQ